ncbi:MAG: GDP-mannose 4,6-dehydratase, partial [Candidatus Woesearchaeota archaeon]
MVKKALITGITGQDGSYLAEFLLKKGYEVHGMVRRTSTFNRERIEHLTDPENFFEVTKGPILHYADLTDSSSIDKLISVINPDEVYNLGAQSHVGISFEIPENTVDVVALGTLRLLEAIRKHCPSAKYYQASSSEMFG